MKTKKIKLLWSMTVFVLGLSLVDTAPLVAQDNCQPVDDALNKVMTIPTHIYSTMNAVPNAGDKLQTYETIYVRGSVYTKVGGKWTRSLWTLQRVMKQEQENRQKSKYTCRYLHDESVNGETAAVYSTYSERPDEDLGQIKSGGQVWISKSKGLPLRQEFDIESGGAGKRHHSVHYEYTNVQPPL